MELEDELIKTLDKSNGYCEHLIFALALLNTENGIAGIERYIQAKADAQREKLDIIRFETVRFGWAFAAIAWLDKLNDTNRLEKTLHFRMHLRKT